MIIVKGKKIDPTQTAMEMTQNHEDENGKIWAKGTEYQPISAGKAGGLDYQDVTIKGEDVRFYGK